MGLLADWRALWMGDKYFIFTEFQRHAEDSSHGCERETEGDGGERCLVTGKRKIGWQWIIFWFIKNTLVCFPFFLFPHRLLTWLNCLMNDRISSTLMENNQHEDTGDGVEEDQDGDEEAEE